MKAKEYLRQIYKLKVGIDQKQEEAESIMEMALSVKSPGLSPEKVGSGGPGDKVASLVTKYLELYEEVQEQQMKMTTLKHKIIDEINQLSDSTYIQILHKRYVCMEPFTKIAYELGYNYSWCLELHGLALKAFEDEILKEPMKTDDDV